MIRDDLTDAPARIRVRGGTLGTPLHILDVTTSTNDEAHRGAKAGAVHGSTWVAEEQSAGRGRRGRSWLSPGGEGLLFSVLLRLSCAPSRLPPLALLAGLAVREAVGRAAPNVDVRIKWPNDVVVGPRKLAGVLVEAITVGARVDAVIVGIGINVRTRSFPEDIRETATSLALEAMAEPPARASLLADVLWGIEHDLDRVVTHGLALVRARMEAADALRGHSVRNDSGDVGEASGIDDEGRLVVLLATGARVRWSAGEVHLVRAVNPG